MIFDFDGVLTVGGEGLKQEAWTCSYARRPAHKQIFQGSGKVQRRKRVSVRHSPAKYELTAAYADGYNTIVNKLLSNP